MWGSLCDLWGLCSFYSVSTEIYNFFLPTYLFAGFWILQNILRLSQLLYSLHCFNSLKLCTSLLCFVTCCENSRIIQWIFFTRRTYGVRSVDSVFAGCMTAVSLVSYINFILFAEFSLGGTPVASTKKCPYGAVSNHYFLFVILLQKYLYIKKKLLLNSVNFIYLTCLPAYATYKIHYELKLFYSSS